MNQEEDYGLREQDIVNIKQVLEGLFWFLLLCFFIDAFYLHLTGFQTYQDFTVFGTKWWFRFGQLEFPYNLYFVSGSTFFFLLSGYLIFTAGRFTSKRAGSAASFTSLATGLFWAFFSYFLYTAETIYTFIFSLYLWSFTLLFLGATFVLTGFQLDHKEEGSKRLTELTVLSFKLTGYLFLFVAFLGGFTPFPYLWVLDYPTTMAFGMIPCFLAIIYTYDSGSSRNTNSE